MVLSPGFGFLPDVIVDQHFRERDRFGRLLAAVLRNPGMRMASRTAATRTFVRT